MRPPMKLVVARKLLAANDRLAALNRARLAAAGVYAVNLLGGPGAGKTALLEALLPRLRARGIAAAVIEGDQATRRDAARIAALGVPVVQVTTGAACHLDAGMVAAALGKLPSPLTGEGGAQRRVRVRSGASPLTPTLSRKGRGSLPAARLLFIENVGNLICPAEFDLGESLRLAVLGASEGDEKVAKHPATFRGIAALVLGKTDLLPYLDFDLGRLRADLRRLAPRARLFCLSAKTGEGVEALAGWLIKKAGARLAAPRRRRGGGGR